MDGIPGVGRRTAEIIVAEVGPTVAAFATVGQFVAWAGRCPVNHESAGKRRRGTSRKGALAFKTAHVTRTKKDCYLGAKYRRLRSGIGAKRAALAVAHSIGVSLDSMLLRGEPYAGPAANHLDMLRTDGQTRHHVRALRALGYDVTLAQIEPST